MYWINQQNCRACLVCVDACPTPGAMVVRNERPVIDLSRCTECGTCVEACPHGAIEEVAEAEGEIIQQRGTAQAPDLAGTHVPPRPQVPVARKEADPPAQRPEAQPPATQQAGGILRAIVEAGGAIISAFGDAMERADDSARGTGRSTGRSGGRGMGNRAGKGGGRHQRQRGHGGGRGRGRR